MDKSKMIFKYGDTSYRLRFSYSPDDKVVTRCTLEKRASAESPWEPVAYAQVYRIGAAKNWVQREVDRQRALNKLLYAQCGSNCEFSRGFRGMAWKAYWERGASTAPAKY